MVTNSSDWMAFSEGTPWGRLPLGPDTTMGSKDMSSAPWWSMRYWSRAAISFSVTPGRISFRISARARSAIRWAETMISSSSGSLTARSSESRSAAGTSSQGRARARAPCSRTVMYASSNPRRRMR